LWLIFCNLLFLKKIVDVSFSFLNPLSFFEVSQVLNLLGYAVLGLFGYTVIVPKVQDLSP